MKIEIYNKGKLFGEIKSGQINLLTKYVGVNQHGDVSRVEDVITLGIGTNDYWFCITKLDILEAKKLNKSLERIIKQFNDDDQVGEIVK